MNILVYKDLSYSGLNKQFKKTVDFLKNGDFISADIKKMVNTGYYRAKLDKENRLLFKFGTFNNKFYILLLEIIKNHNYDKSRFLRGAKIDEDKLIPLKNENEINEENIVNLNYVSPHSSKFHLLDKYISFDKIQDEIFKTKPPVVIIGSAGSGKTVLTLEKIKSLKGNILYVTLSPFLAENSAKLYYSNNYLNENQEIDFLSYKEFLETLHIIPGREFDYKSFESWLHPRKQALGIKNTYKLFEEIKGVITGLDISKEFLTQKDYLELGIKQSIYLKNDREKVYEAFIKYLDFINSNNYFDLNIISYKWLAFCRPKYDFIIIDEIQDFTNIQLYIILKSLKIPENFILCGDANQIVHPNFFSWTHVKTMFYKNEITSSEIKILRTNYRNSTQITELSNSLLKIKNARFGSIDKESTYLIESLENNKGEILFFKDTPKNRKQINSKTSRSTKFAVLVMNPEEKVDIKKTFKTPLIFSIHEAKGLEYDNIILVNFISNNAKEFAEIVNGVTEKEIKNNKLIYSRGKDKSDKALDAYKFYINSLYVGITRAIKNLYFLEGSDKHEILKLLDLVETKQVEIKQSVSSTEEWEQEVRKLEMQGKMEQAEEIKKTILNIQKPDWEPITPENVEKLKQEALDPSTYNKKAKDKLFAYSVLYNDLESIENLSKLKYRKADYYEKERNSIFRKYYSNYQSNNIKGVEQNIKKYGVDYRDRFNLTPLLAASITGSVKIIEMLIKYNANPEFVDNLGRNPLQIALFQSFFSTNFFSKLGNVYNGLAAEYVKIQVSGKMIKINKRKFEYILINFFIALQKVIIDNKTKKRLYTVIEGVTAPDLVEYFNLYPENIIPDFRKKRSYISAMLSKNEVDGNNPYNNKLFIRTDRGVYSLNPDLEIFVNNGWKNVYEIMKIKKIKKLTEQEKMQRFFENMFNDLYSQNNIEDFAFQKKHNSFLYNRFMELYPDKMKEIDFEVEAWLEQEKEDFDDFDDFF